MSPTYPASPVSRLSHSEARLLTPPGSFGATAPQGSETVLDRVSITLGALIR